MEDKIINIIKSCVDKENRDSNVESSWREPVIGFASADDPMFLKLKEVIGEKHDLPQDILSGAKSIVAYFIPFEKDIIKSNMDGIESSKEWDDANIETDALLEKINDKLIDFFKSHGHRASDIPPTEDYNGPDLKSNWSHRHVAYIAGLGTFGINNMLITKRGSCGRIGTIITTMELKPTERSDTENCLFKYNGSCEVCVDRCVANAISHGDSYPWVDRQKCNKQVYGEVKRVRKKGNRDTCGKCMVGVPCSSTNPTEKL